MDVRDFRAGAPVGVTNMAAVSISYGSCHKGRAKAESQAGVLREETRDWGVDLAITVIGVGKGRPSPPSELCVRFSRTQLSGRWFPHRDWLACT